jgi:hypothetical protein
MKYLKRFENFYSGSTELDFDDWWRRVNSRSVTLSEFTTSEIEQMSDFIRRYELSLEYDRLLELNYDKTHYTINDFRKVEKTSNYPRGKYIVKAIEISKRDKVDDPGWFYFGYAEFDEYGGAEVVRKFECSTFEDLIEKLEELLNL